MIRLNASPEICIKAEGIDDFWVSADQDEEDIISEIDEKAGDKAWEINGADGFGDIDIDDSTGLGEISEIAQFLAKYEDGVGSAVLMEYNLDVSDAESAMDYIEGPFTNEEDYAQSYIDSVVGPLPHLITSNLNLLGVLEDIMQFQTSFETDSGEFYVIREH
jgi:antirestriction protein